MKPIELANLRTGHVLITRKGNTAIYSYIIIKFCMDTPLLTHNEDERLRRFS